ncbi:MFS transporter [Streptomyces ochraceiscleroticus]|uniref:MFS transporter n=1 Tax=Streptomyces ochraceiscleroticus TaxID=47761 RepID=A0ABW1MHZ0_9ACTN|nr:MFS transporter [Streptomyces ochraceiscleroticus]
MSRHSARFTITPPATTAPDAGPPPLAPQKRILTALLISQVLSGAGLAAGVTVGALLSQDMLGGTALAGLPSALLTAGSALAAVAVGRISQARGRRPGLATGYLVGAIGSAGVIAATLIDNPLLLFPSLFLYGAGTAANLQARYAGADLAAPSRRARAVSTVLVATTLGGVAGPNLAAPAGQFAAVLGLPRLSGLFLVSGTAYALAALVLLLWLRPDPLLLARTLHSEQQAAEAGSAAAAAVEPSSAATGRRPGLALGVLVMVLTQLVMVAVMTMTPVHMHAHGQGTAASGLVIGLHVGAMYLPSPLTGWLVDRYGRSAIATAAGLTLLASGVLAATAPGDSVPLLALALILLGVGWNFGLVSGTTLITDAVPLATRAKTQGLVDVAVAIAGATGGLASGLVVAAAGYSLLAIAGGALALAVLPAILATARKR